MSCHGNSNTHLPGKSILFLDYYSFKTVCSVRRRLGKYRCGQAISGILPVPADRDGGLSRVAMYVYAGEELARYGFGDGHPFGPDRFRAFWQEFLARGLEERVEVRYPVSGDREDLLLFHTPEYVRRVETLTAQGIGMLDPDTPAAKGIYESALYVVGTVLDAVEMIIGRKTGSAFVPIAGLHHARRDSSAGFCVFNDIGIAVEALRQRHGVERIGYVDIDAHHGDGVFYAFEEDRNLVFADLHEDGRYLYPGTGDIHEIGRGDAAGTKLNVPLPPGSDDEIFLEVWPKVKGFIADHKPQFLIMQCGADSIAGDPITHMAFSSKAHYHAARELADLAAEPDIAGLLALGGGGYNRASIADAWTSVIQGVLDSENN